MQRKISRQQPPHIIFDRMVTGIHIRAKLNRDRKLSLTWSEIVSLFHDTKKGANFLEEEITKEWFEGYEN